MQIPEWADIIYNFVKTYGLGDSVMVVEELSSGDDVRGTGEDSAGCA
jgi:ESCRT-II complex subunit VPS25